MPRPIGLHPGPFSRSAPPTLRRRGTGTLLGTGPTPPPGLNPSTGAGTCPGRPGTGRGLGTYGVSGHAASVAGATTAGGRQRRRRAQRPTPRPAVQHAPQLPAVSLYTELRRRVLTLQAPPAPLRGALKTALRDGLERIRRDPASSEGWALFLLAPRMLLYRQQGENKIALEELHRRVAALATGHHQQLLDEAAAAQRP